MKLVRFGNEGSEKPGMIDSNGNLRDLSAHVADITPATIADICLLYTSPSPRDLSTSRMPSSA